MEIVYRMLAQSQPPWRVKSSEVREHILMGAMDEGTQDELVWSWEIQQGCE